MGFHGQTIAVPWIPAVNHSFLRFMFFKPAQTPSSMKKNFSAQKSLKSLYLLEQTPLTSSKTGIIMKNFLLILLGYGKPFQSVKRMCLNQCVWGELSC